MLERDIMIDGEVWPTHKAVLVTLVPDVEIIATVRSTRQDDENLFIETSHTLPWTDGMKMADIEEALWALPEMEEYVDKGEILDGVLDILTDEQAETVSELYPEWAAGVEYAIGKRVRYQDKLYRCVQAHTSSAEYTPLVHSLWTRTAAEGEIPDWVQPEGSHDAYNKGDRVRYQGKVWESTVNENVWAPGVYGWSEATE